MPENVRCTVESDKKCVATKVNPSCKMQWLLFLRQTRQNLHAGMLENVAVRFIQRNIRNIDACMYSSYIIARFTSTERSKE